MNGAFDYTRTPLAPPGMRVLAHIPPDKRLSWAPNAEHGFYVGPAMHHYCHLEFYIPASRGVRKSDTYVFLPTKFELPASAAADRMTIALEELTNAILITEMKFHSQIRV